MFVMIPIVGLIIASSFPFHSLSKFPSKSQDCAFIDCRTDKGPVVKLWASDYVKIGAQQG
jgi:hypothetical protein